jgi:hypothetical protein
MYMFNIRGKSEYVMKRQEIKQRVEFGFAIPRETAERIEKIKGPYITRTKFIVKAIDCLLLAEEERQQQQEKLRGAEVATTNPHSNTTVPNRQDGDVSDGK